ncbi:MAG: TIGR01777 family oxidoreductase [Acidimicrobiales bacterium]
MDIAITGSSGLIGTRLVAALESEGHRVLRIVRRASDRPTADEAIWDPSAGAIDATALEGLDAVVHLAGEGIAERRWTPEQKARISDSRSAGTTLIANTLASLTRPPRRLLSGSAIGIYGDTAARPTDESSPVGTGFLPDVCLAWEAAAQPAIDAGISTAFLRTGIVLSTDGGALAKQLPFFKAGLGGRSGSGRQYQSWIAIDDEIASIVWLLSSDITGPVNLTAPNPVTNAEFAKALGAALHRPTTVIPMIGPRLLYGRELADTLLLESQRILPAKLESGGYQFRFPELDAALAHVLR